MMKIRAPIGEPGKIIPDFLRIRVEDVRAVFVDQDAMLAFKIVGVARDVATALDDQHFLVELGGDPLGQYRAGETRAGDDPVVPAQEKRTGALLPSQKAPVREGSQRYEPFRLQG